MTDLLEDIDAYSTEEARGYLEYFQSLDPQKFAVIKVGGDLIEDDEQLEPMAASFAKLGELGLTPVIVHGGGSQIDVGLAEAGIESTKVAGMRVTSAEASLVIPGVLAAVNDKLTSAINQDAVVAEGLTGGVFAAQLSNYRDYGSAREVQTDISRVVDVVNRGRIPVLSCTGNLVLGGNISNQPVNLNGDLAATAMAGALVPNKFMALTEAGAVRGEGGERLSSLSPETANKLIDAGIINHGMGPKVKNALQLFSLGVHDVVITSPQALLQELFTSSGAGTLIHHN